jgi:predicted dehydrogenase
MSTSLRVGIVGYGIAGQVFHAPLIAATDGLTPSVIVTSSPERVAQARADHPDATIVPTMDDLLGHSDELDLVVVASTNATHVALTLKAIEAGLPVVVDKPIAPTVAEAELLVATALARGVGLTVFQNRRWDSDFLTLRKVLDSGRLGNVVRFESRYDRWRPVPKEGWRELADPAQAGGLLFDLGAHIVDQALQLFGPVREVYAEVDVRREGAEVDDDVFVALHHSSGVRTHLWTSVLAATLNPRFRVLGDAATFTKFGLDVQEPQIKDGLRPGDPGWGVEPIEDAGTVSDGTVIDLVHTEVGCYQDFYAGVRDALLTRSPFPVDPADAVAALRVIEAARISATEHRVVQLEGTER